MGKASKEKQQPSTFQKFHRHLDNIISIIIICALCSHWTDQFHWSSTDFKLSSIFKSALKWMLRTSLLSVWDCRSNNSGENREQRVTKGKLRKRLNNENFKFESCLQKTNALAQVCFLSWCGAILNHQVCLQDLVYCGRTPISAQRTNDPFAMDCPMEVPPTQIGTQRSIYCHAALSKSA